MFRELFFHRIRCVITRLLPSSIRSGRSKHLSESSSEREGERETDASVQARGRALTCTTKTFLIFLAEITCKERERERIWTWDREREEKPLLHEEEPSSIVSSSSSSLFTAIVRRISAREIRRDGERVYVQTYVQEPYTHTHIRPIDSLLHTEHARRDACAGRRTPKRAKLLLPVLLA